MVMKNFELKVDVMLVVLVIVQKVGGLGANVQKLLAGVGLDKVKLEIIQVQYGVGIKQQDVIVLLWKHVSDLLLIMLWTQSYNISFGGDLVLGIVKKLIICYWMNGKLGEVLFLENVLIILFMLK